MSDYLRELHQIDPGEDLPTAAECAVETTETLARLEAGDLSVVPPWMTLEECIVETRAQLARYRAMPGV